MIPWDAWIAHGLGRLRLAPDAFWALSIREWRAVLAAGGAQGALSREELNALMRTWPDVPERTG